MKARSSCAGDDGAGSPGLLFRGLGLRVESLGGLGFRVWGLGAWGLELRETLAGRQGHKRWLKR